MAIFPNLAVLFLSASVCTLTWKQSQPETPLSRAAKVRVVRLIFTLLHFSHFQRSEDVKLSNIYKDKRYELLEKQTDRKFISWHVTRQCSYISTHIELAASMSYSDELTSQRETEREQVWMHSRRRNQSDHFPPAFPRSLSTTLCSRTVLICTRMHTHVFP